MRHVRAPCVTDIFTIVIVITIPSILSISTIIIIAVVVADDDDDVCDVLYRRYVHGIRAYQ